MYSISRNPYLGYNFHLGVECRVGIFVGTRRKFVVWTVDVWTVECGLCVADSPAGGIWILATLRGCEFSCSLYRVADIIILCRIRHSNELMINPPNEDWNFQGLRYLTFVKNLVMCRCGCSMN